MKPDQSTDYSLLSAAPEFTADLLWAHLETLDPDFAKVMQLEGFETKEAREDKVSVVHYLYKENPGAFLALQDIERAWQAAWDVAFDQREAIFRLYKQQKVVHDELNALRRSVHGEEWEDKQIAEAHASEKADTWFENCEAWTGHFNPLDFTFFRSRERCAALADYKTWQTIYHCNGQWAMEQLGAIKEKAGVKVAKIRATKIPADLDMLRWKVVTDEAFLRPLGPDNKRRKTAS